MVTHYRWDHGLTLFGTGLKIYAKWWGGVRHHPLLNTQNHCEKPKKFFCFSDRSYRNRKVTKFVGLMADFW